MKTTRKDGYISRGWPNLDSNADINASAIGFKLIFLYL